MRLGLVDVIGHITPRLHGLLPRHPRRAGHKAEGTRVPGRISVLPPPAADGYSERERQMAVGPLRTGVTQRDAQPVPAFAANARHHAKCRTVAGRSIGDSPFGRSEDIRPTDPCSREQRHFRRQMQVVIRNGHQAEHHKRVLRADARSQPRSNTTRRAANPHRREFSGNCNDFQRPGKSPPHRCQSFRARHSQRSPRQPPHPRNTRPPDNGGLWPYPAPASRKTEARQKSRKSNVLSSG